MRVVNTFIRRDSEYRFFFILGLVFAFLSGIRLPFLPEFQLTIFVVFVFKERKLSYKVLLLLATILCTHHYVIPDFVYRIDGAAYPSIYTRAYGSVKLLDLLVVFLFIVCFRLFISRNILKIFYIKSLPTILFFTSFVGLLFINSNQFSTSQFLFITRSYLLFFSIFILSINISREQFQGLSWLVVFCWTVKMIMSILIPHQHPLTRNILGIDGIIFFAGDEYMTIPYYLAMLIIIGGKNFNYRDIYSVLFIVLFLTILAQRKGALQVLGIFIAVVYAYKNSGILCRGLVKIYCVFSAIITFLFLYYIDKIVSDPLILLAFDEYSNFAQISIKSLHRLHTDNPLGFFFGISPFGKYQIVDLPSYMDHVMSFGKEVGEVYRYQFWSFPYGRCILNDGLIGFIYVMIMILRTLKYNVVMMYLVIAAIPLCYYNNLTPINAFAMGIVYAFLYNSINQKDKLFSLSVK